jgi:D-alanyl-D-alanine carboxypeptidase
MTNSKVLRYALFSFYLVVLVGAVFAQDSGVNEASVSQALKEAHIPSAIAQGILRAGPAFEKELRECTAGDPHLWLLVDKTHPLDPRNYRPPNLVKLGGPGKAYVSTKKNIFLRAVAERALNKMARAAQKEGVRLVVSSAYRSYDYQVIVYNRLVKLDGQEQADRESAQPGTSQHQTGLALDFGSITNDFAASRAGRWVVRNASRFGWSLSFPKGYESVTGYEYESWHYRYVGKKLAAFIDTYFRGIQQYALMFLNRYCK